MGNIYCFINSLRIFWITSCLNNIANEVNQFSVIINVPHNLLRIKVELLLVFTTIAIFIIPYTYYMR